MDRQIIENTEISDFEKNENSTLKKEYIRNNSKYRIYILVPFLLLLVLASNIFLHSIRKSSDNEVVEIDNSLVTEKTDVLESTLSIDERDVDNEDSKLDQTIVWKEYSDLKNKISFQYPSSAEFVNIPDSPRIEFQENNCVSYGPYQCAWWVRFVGIYQNPENQEINVFLKKLFRSLYEEETWFETLEVEKISGYKTYSVSFDYSKSPDGASPGSAYYIMRESDVIHLDIGVLGNENNRDDYQENVDRVLSSISLK